MVQHRYTYLCISSRLVVTYSYILLPIGTSHIKHLLPKVEDLPGGARLGTDDETDFIWPLFFQFASALSSKQPDLEKCTVLDMNDYASKRYQREILKQKKLEDYLQEVEKNIAEYPLCWFVYININIWCMLHISKSASKHLLLQQYYFYYNSQDLRAWVDEMCAYAKAWIKENEQKQEQEGEEIEEAKKEPARMEMQNRNPDAAGTAASTTAVSDTSVTASTEAETSSAGQKAVVVPEVPEVLDPSTNSQAEGAGGSGFDEAQDNEEPTPHSADADSQDTEVVIIEQVSSETKQTGKEPKDLEKKYEDKQSKSANSDSDDDTPLQKKQKESGAGRPKGASNKNHFTDDELQEQFIDSFDIKSVEWERLADLKEDHFTTKGWMKFSVVFCDPMFKESKCYKTEYVKNLLTTVSPFMLDTGVLVYMGYNIL